jgi:glutamyl-tRNA synthetase
MRPRVRFAPSPTGYLHVGGARTALFNWLYARRHGGTFVLRIEDTDVGRSSDDMVAGILEGLRWLGLDWDEGPEVGGPHAPYFQSGRLERYRALAEGLVTDGHAYYCYCTQERLQQERQAAEAAGGGWMYDRRCLSLSPEQIAEYEATGVARAVRFRVPPGETRFDDLVKGPITFGHAHIEDFVLLRSDGYPTYQLSVVADDVDMGITHVVRGDDHISNTPKQQLLYEALGAPPPRFGHVPLILGPDKKRLSKRHGATSVTEYARQGYLSAAMVNFLALLGWSPGTDKEIFTTEELIGAFTLEGISGGNAVFNVEKLDWMNAQHISRMGPAAVLDRIAFDLHAAGTMGAGRSARPA